MSAIDTAALDEAVRRFPSMLATYRRTGTGVTMSLPIAFIGAIQREYRLVLAERSKGRGV